MEIRKLLPIGSVVILKDSEKKLMIYGIKQTQPGTNKTYDYAGVLYPEGVIGSSGQFRFNHDDIVNVYFKGYESEERIRFLDNFAEYYDNLERYYATEN